MYYNYIKCKVICLGIKHLIKTRGKPLAEAPNRQLAVFPTIRRPCTDFLTGLSACLPACAYLPVPAYLSVPTRLGLPVGAYLSGPTCLGLPVWAYLSGPTWAYLSVPTYVYLSVSVCGG